MKLNSTMRAAFINAHVKTPDVARIMPLIDQVDTSLRCGLGIRISRDWDAKLKLKTYKDLKSKGIMA